MQVIDFSRSFFTFRIDTTRKAPKSVSHEPPYSLNNARIQIDCRCKIRERASGKEQSFLLGANCKTERVGVPRDIWLEPNADFVPVFSDEGFLHIKTYAHTGIRVDAYPPGSGKQPDRLHGKTSELFDDVHLDLVMSPAREPASSREIVEATLANHPLVAVTRYASDRYDVTLEYPIKTMNANERDWVYQTDTGPVLVPDLAAEPEQLLERMELAFAAFNSRDWMELLVRVATPIQGGVSIYHYSESRRLECENRVLQLG